MLDERSVEVGDCGVHWGEKDVGPAAPLRVAGRAWYLDMLFIRCIASAELAWFRLGTEGTEGMDCCVVFAWACRVER